MENTIKSMEMEKAKLEIMNAEAIKNGDYAKASLITRKIVNIEDNIRVLKNIK